MVNILRASTNNMRKMKIKLFLVPAAWLAAIIFVHTGRNHSLPDKPATDSLQEPTSQKHETSLSHPNIVYNFDTAKKILYFNDFYENIDWNFGLGHAPFVDRDCPVSNCYVTNDRSVVGSLAEFDAILFHGQYMDRRLVRVPSQAKRRREQRYVLFLMESPLNDGLNYTNKR